MRDILTASVICLVAAATGSATADPHPNAAKVEGAYEPGAGHAVTTSLETWHDASRDRDVPVKVYLPRALGESDTNSGVRETPLPVLVYSHGMGGSREVGTYLASHLAERGYVVVCPQHAGSDRDSLRRGRGGVRDRLLGGVENPDNLRNRPADISFVLDKVLGGALGEGVTIDAEKIGVLGHSFGAYTSMAVSGLLVDLPGADDTSFRDGRVRAAVAMSPQGTGTMGINEGAWDEIDIPVMLMTGSEDGRGRDQEKDADWRREGFSALSADDTRSGDAYFVWIEGATHLAFGDTRNRAMERLRGGRDPRHHGWIRQCVLAFFDAELRGDPVAEQWLREGAIEGVSGEEVTIDRAPGSAE